MNCEDCLLMLDEYVEHELDEKSAVLVSTHLDACRACGGEYRLLLRELQTYSQYLLSVKATPALWTNVRADIEKAQGERFSLNNLHNWAAKAFSFSAFNPAFAAVPLALLITLGIVIGIITYESSENPNNEKVVSQKTDIQSLPEKTNGDAINEIPNKVEKAAVGKSENKIRVTKIENRIKRNETRSILSKPKNQFVNSKFVGSNQPTTEEVIEKAERQYEAAIAVLSSDIKRRRMQLSPNLISQLEQSLPEIDRTIHETRRAVREQPNDAVAVQYMTSAYSKKIELLRAVAGN